MAAHRNRVKASFRNDAANKILEELRLKWQSANCNAYYLRIKWGISTVDLGQILSAFFISPYADFSSHSTGCRRSTPSGAVNSILSRVPSLRVSLCGPLTDLVACSRPTSAIHSVNDPAQPSILKTSPKLVPLLRSPAFQTRLAQNFQLLSEDVQPLC